MSEFTVSLVALLILAAILLTVTFRRPGTGSIGRLTPGTRKSDRGPVSPELPSPIMTDEKTRHGRRDEPDLPTRSTSRVDADPETLGVARRQFLNRGITAVLGIGLAAFGAETLAFLWPRTGTDFGSKINIGSLSDVKKAIGSGRGFHYVPEGRMWITEYPASALERARSSYTFFNQVEPGLRAGVTALYQVCPHLGCRVPECTTSQWFECPCHGSKYNRVGEKKAGPAPRGMDRFPMEVNAAGELIVDTSQIILGPPVGVNTTGQEAEGPNCFGSGQAHV